MRESAHTLYVASDHGASVGAALAALLADESYAPEGGRSQVGWWRQGAPGWTVLETFPPELLLDRPPGAKEPRIATLARRLESDVIYLAIHEGKEVLLVEADGRGRWGATGSGELSDRGPITRDREDPRACRDGGVLRFVVLDVAAPIQESITKGGTGAIRGLAKLCGGKGSPLPFAPDHEAGGTPIVFSRARGAGARVRHAKFGEGTILDELGGDPPKLNVAFDDGRNMLLLARFLERITT